jgi:hypothetical protein
MVAGKVDDTVLVDFGCVDKIAGHAKATSIMH